MKAAGRAISVESRSARWLSGVLSICCLWPFAGHLVYAQEASSPEPPAPTPIHLGQVQVDEAKRQVIFPAFLNQTEGALEYVLVGSAGKTHESLLRTDVEPFQLHTAMLLLGVKTGDRHPGSPPPSAINADYLRTAPALKGDAVAITLKWRAAGKDVSCHPEELVFNAQTHAAATVGDWLYNGSMFEGNEFLAQQEKSFVALVTDPAALMNNPRPGHDNDQIWSVLTAKAPPQDTPVEITITLPPKAASPPAPVAASP